MKKCIIMSDTHGSQKGIDKIKALFAENDYIIHLGDGAGDLKEIFSAYPDKVFQCKGNCDFISVYPDEQILEIEQVRILCCHGHQYGVKTLLGVLAQAAKEKGCDVALYGHTHRADICEMDGVTLINPGSLRYSAGEGGSYCYLVVHKDKITPVIVGDNMY